MSASFEIQFSFMVSTAWFAAYRFDNYLNRPGGRWSAGAIGDQLFKSIDRFRKKVNLNKVVTYHDPLKQIFD